MIDPDKKVEKDKAEYSYVYQSSQQPLHFENEGGEYIEAEPNRIDASTGIIEYKDIR
ncbi:MAG: hypothetical protein J7604_09755 [Sporocytophaga sp.]|uniref:hypothetical protein n=1 Tax=Sporocytophaga sp. TaxID=2231183 RepID=UPI001B02837A|nr:hypothetical protein [Sporocytophaga sp.]MBO9700480.1 hypothetical protein [Sporocytophaga sp.]